MNIEVRKYSTLEDCLNSEQLDAIHICVHTDLHYRMVKKALNYGLHVLVEKPFCFNIEEGEELIKLAKIKSCILMVAHVVRFMPPYQKLKNWIDNNTFGKLKFLSLTRFSGIPLWGQWKEKQADFGSSGGALFDLLIHDIDFASYIMGKSPDKLDSTYLPGKLSNYDYVNALWEYDNSKVTIKIEGGNIFHSEFPFQCGYIAGFEKATVYYSSLNPQFISISTNIKTEYEIAGDLNDGYKNEISYFYDCIENTIQPSICSPESSLEAIRICHKHINNK